ncbi:MAG: rhomboid family intramembrane serine protease [Candidatus Altiarchaeales archaeon]|nr:rhomboid family intramembrane serine protease [Candidatus Altiarchaeales archaeon]
MRFLGSRIGAVEALMAVNFIAFLATMVFPTIMLTLFALSPGTVVYMPWTILTSMFLHADVMHIIFNMMAFYFFSLYLENLVGEKNMLKVFFTGGIAGSIFYILSSFTLGTPEQNTFALGASGGIFAIAGALAILRPYMKVVMIPIFIPMPLYIAVFVFMVLLSFMPGVAWQGHLGGLITGVLFGLRWKKRTVELIAVKEPYGYRFY